MVPEDAKAPRMTDEKLHHLNAVGAAIDQITDTDENVSVFIVLSRRKNSEKHFVFAVDVTDDKKSAAFWQVGLHQDKYVWAQYFAQRCSRICSYSVISRKFSKLPCSC